MKRYHIAAICMMGHVVEMESERFGFDKYCAQCGRRVVDRCQKCGAPIRGHIDEPYAFMASYHPPRYCYECGNPYPWTEASINELQEIINDEYAFDDIRDSLVLSIPDLYIEGPGTKIAVTRFQKACLDIGGFVGKTICQILIENGCDFVKEHFADIMEQLQGLPK